MEEKQPTEEGTTTSTVMDVDKAFNDSIQLWKEVYIFKSENKNLDDETFKQKVQELHDKLNEKYSDFFYTFPIVGKLIVLSSMYHPNPMKEYLKYYFNESKKEQEQGMKTYKDFIELQTDYIYYYWKNIYSNTPPGTRKLSNNQIEEYSKKEKNKLKDQLIIQYKNFKSAYNKIMTENSNMNIDIKKEKLKNYIKNM